MLGILERKVDKDVVNAITILPDSIWNINFLFFSSGGPLQNFQGLLRKLSRRRKSEARKEEKGNLFDYLEEGLIRARNRMLLPSLSLCPFFLLSGMTDPRGASVSGFPRRFFQLCRPLAGPPSRAKWIIDGTKQWRSFVPRASNVICSMQGLSVRQFCAHRVV